MGKHDKEQNRIIEELANRKAKEDREQNDRELRELVDKYNKLERDND